MDISILPGLVAVQVFFIISGFYMSLILKEKYKTNTILFYTNRLFRPFPTYLLVLVLSVIALTTLDVDAFTHVDKFENTVTHSIVDPVLRRR
jgi:peptidoglycan/LPS O-acetylase OafA/YrhL